MALTSQPNFVPGVWESGFKIMFHTDGVKSFTPISNFSNFEWHIENQLKGPLSTRRD